MRHENHLPHRVLARAQLESMENVRIFCSHTEQDRTERDHLQLSTCNNWIFCIICVILWLETVEQYGHAIASNFISGPITASVTENVSFLWRHRSASHILIECIQLSWKTIESSSSLAIPRQLRQQTLYNHTCKKARTKTVFSLYTGNPTRILL